jgi:hypothetical protein
LQLIWLQSDKAWYQALHQIPDSGPENGWLVKTYIENMIPPTPYSKTDLTIVNTLSAPYKSNKLKACIPQERVFTLDDIFDLVHIQSKWAG